MQEFRGGGGGGGGAPTNKKLNEVEMSVFTEMGWVREGSRKLW